MSEESTTPQYYTCDTSKMRVYWDTEMTDLNEGRPAQIGLVKSDPSKPGEPVVARLTLPCRVPLNAVFSGPGEKQFKKLKEQCAGAADDAIVVSQIKEFIGSSDDTVLSGFCFHHKDLNILQKWSPELKEYLDGFAVQDVAYALAFQYWKTTGGRSLERIALTLGVKIDKSRLHTAVYDAELAKEVDVKLRGLIALGIPSTSIPLVGKDEEWDDRRFNPVPEAAAPAKSSTIDAIESQNVVKEPEEPMKKKKSKAWEGPYGEKGNDNTPKIFITYEEAKKVADAFNTGKIPMIPCPGNDGGLLIVKTNGQEVPGNIDHWFLGCSLHRETKCRCTCNIDGTKGAIDDRKIDKRYIPVRHAVLEFLGYEPDC